jgi:thiol-disulfide isomerase/thioredoxin
MRKRLNIFTALGLFVICCGMSQGKSQPINQQPFSKPAFEKMKQQQLGKRWLMVLWSLDCPACFKELKLIQTLQLEHNGKALNVIFINADDTDEVNLERQQVLVSYEMNNFTNFYFTDGQGDLNRYQIDPQWYGELPRSYFVDELGKPHGKSGLLDEKLIKKWLIEK